jgi:hypothetical protein
MAYGKYNKNQQTPERIEDDLDLDLEFKISLLLPPIVEAVEAGSNFIINKCQVNITREQQTFRKEHAEHKCIAN